MLRSFFKTIERTSRILALEIRQPWISTSRSTEVPCAITLTYNSGTILGQASVSGNQDKRDKRGKTDSDERGDGQFDGPDEGLEDDREGVLDLREKNLSCERIKRRH